MNQKKRELFSNLKYDYWKNLILFAVFIFYLSLFIAMVFKGSFLSDYGGDYLAFWSIGKIADEKGYSEIYDLNNLRSVQIQELRAYDLFNKTGNPSYSPIPAPIFSFFVLPFQLLSKVDIHLGYWIWTIINLAIMIGYLVFFLKKIIPGSGATVSDLNILILVLVSFPLFNNIFGGQVQYFLLVCTGEFIRNSVSKKPLLSGLWLGGLLLKPQLLILIVPIIVIFRYWKVLIGFIISSGVILITSFFLSGLAGMKALINLWSKYAVGLAAGAPEFMINWRMIGVNLYTHMNISTGWVIAGLGMVLTILAVYLLIKYIPLYGSPPWVLTMLGVFSATLAITWHSHYHMALVLLPFYVFVLLYKMLPEKIVFFWVILTPVALFGSKIFSLLFFIWTKNFFIHEWEIIGFSGFIVNLVILIFITRYPYTLKLKQV